MYTGLCFLFGGVKHCKVFGECKLNCLESANTVSFSHFQNNEAIGEYGGHSSIGLHPG